MFDHLLRISAGSEQGYPALSINAIKEIMTPNKRSRFGAEEYTFVLLPQPKYPLGVIVKHLNLHIFNNPSIFSL
jgi:hypothetical protein